MTTPALRSLLDFLEGFQAKDIEAVIGRLRRRRRVHRPALPAPEVLEQPGFTVRHQLSDPENANVAAVEVDTHHGMVGGAMVTPPQVFVAEVGDEGLLRRVQSHPPYPPPAG